VPTPGAKAVTREETHRERVLVANQPEVIAHRATSVGPSERKPSRPLTRRRDVESRHAQRHPQPNLAKQEHSKCSQQNRLPGCV
jgi:hypothetical protein